jgi:hypothetical protein
VITGQARDGKTLRTTLGTWPTLGGSLTYHYQWQRCHARRSRSHRSRARRTVCDKVKRATHRTYKLTHSDVGRKITVTVTATGKQHEARHASAKPVGPVSAPRPPRNRRRPTILGTARVGRTLKTTRGSWSSPDPLSYHYQWWRCRSDGTHCIKIKHTTHRTYKLTRSDIGHKITVTVTAADKEHHARQATAKSVG